jgi:molybdopterin synthase catalytic subunit/molybdopterin converting factor small subunit
MRVRLLSFGPLKTALPPDGAWVELVGKQRVADLVRVLVSQGTFTDAALRTAAVAVNHEYAGPEHVLGDGDEVAILPPVSGGAPSVSDKPDDLVQIVKEPIDGQMAERIVSAVKSGGDGAVCVFDGIVRDNTRGRATLHLDYEAYEEMALKQMRALREDSITRFGVREIAIVHRLGRLFVGETSVLIAVSSAHRSAAFDACRYVIDTLKKTVPIWKREQFADGAVWGDGEQFPEDLSRAGSGVPR